MSFFAVLLALMLEQGRPLSSQHPARQGFGAWTVSVRRWILQAPQRHHSPWLAWSLAALPVTVLVMLLYWLVLWLAWPLALLYSVLVLYMCLGFQQCGLHLRRIRHALANDDLASAQQAWHDWQRPAPCPQSPAFSQPNAHSHWDWGTLLHQTLVYAVLQAQQQVFGVLFWFTVGSLLGVGPAAVVLYRASGHLAWRWQAQAQPQAQAQAQLPALAVCSRLVWAWLNWLPARLTAIGFAIVGSFDSAMDAWRTHASAQPQDHQGVVLAAASGALDVDLGSPQPMLDLQHIDGLTSLTRRLVAMWLLLLALLTLGRLLG